MLFPICRNNQFQVTWGVDFDVKSIQGKRVTITVEGIQDLAGNVMASPVSWSFIPTTYEASTAMVKVDGLEIKNSSPDFFIQAYYIAEKVDLSTQQFANIDEETAFGNAFCYQFSKLVEVDSARCTLTRFSVVNASIIVSFAIAPGVPSSTDLFKQFKDSLQAAVDSQQANLTVTNHTNTTTTPSDGTTDSRKRQTTTAHQNLLAQTAVLSPTTANYDLTVDGTQISTTLGQKSDPMRFFESITILPAGLFVTIAIGIVLGCVLLALGMLIDVLIKRRDYRRETFEAFERQPSQIFSPRGVRNE